MGKKATKRKVKRAKSKKESTDTALAVVEQAPVNDLTPSQQEAGDKRYWKMVEDTIREEKQAVKVVLSAYWNRGERVAALLAEPRQYNKHTAEKFGCDIRPEKPYHGDEVRKWHRFHLMYPREKLNEAIEMGLPWRAVQVLLAVSDSARREELQKDIASGKLKTEDLRVLVKKENTVKRKKAVKAGKKVDGRGGFAYTTTFRVFKDALKDFSTRLDEFCDACSSHNSETGDAALNADSVREECNSGLRDLTRKLNTALTLAPKLVKAPVE